MKDESHRFDLKAFKILGASWGTYRALAERLRLPLTMPIKELGLAARMADIKLFAATDGNHGRAVARMANYLDLEAHIVVPKIMDNATQERIASEGARIEVVEGDYDQAVNTAAQKAAALGGLLVQDTAWPGYEEIPRVRDVCLHRRWKMLICSPSGLLMATRPCYRKSISRSGKSLQSPPILSFFLLA